MGEGKEAREREVVYIIITDSHYRMAETNTAL